MLGVDEAFFDHVVVAEPQIGDVGGAEAQDVGEGATDFGQPEIDTDFFEEVDQGLSAIG